MTLIGIQAVGDHGREETNHQQEAKDKKELFAAIRSELNPRRTQLHTTFTVISVVAIIFNILMALGQLMGIFLGGPSLVAFLLKVYCFMFCILAMINETGMFSLTKESKLLRTWVSRGAFYIFIGLMGLSETLASPTTQEYKEEMQAALGFIHMASHLMIAIGGLYTIMGLLCLQVVFRRLETDYRMRVAKAKEARQSEYGAVDVVDVEEEKPQEDTTPEQFANGLVGYVATFPAAFPAINETDGSV